MSESLSAWIERQYPLSAAGLLRSISPKLTKLRPGFGQSITAAPGSVVASPVLANYDPEPDYFFHWYRDSAIVMEALRLLTLDATLQVEGARRFNEFLTFSRSLLTAAPAIKDHSKVAEDHRQYLRDDNELSQVHGSRVLAETRVNPDGSLDISRWARPQYDGPALRALTLMRWLPVAGVDQTQLKSLLEADLEFTLEFGGSSCYDIWEEEDGYHYYTQRVAAAALGRGALWYEAHGDLAKGMRCRTRAVALRRTLDAYLRANEGAYRSRLLRDGSRSEKEWDIAVILAALHAEPADAKSAGGQHGVLDPAMRATLDLLEGIFAREYPLNQRRGAEEGVALGRYAKDKYYSGGPYFFSTLGAAEFCYRAAEGAGDGAKLIARGDGYLAMVKAHAPADGRLAEQFDRDSGEPRSARDLAWSHAALISCVTARRRQVA